MWTSVLNADSKIRTGKNTNRITSGDTAALEKKRRKKNSINKYVEVTGFRVVKWVRVPAALGTPSSSSYVKKKKKSNTFTSNVIPPPSAPSYPVSSPRSLTNTTHA